MRNTVLYVLISATAILLVIAAYEYVIISGLRTDYLRLRAEYNRFQIDANTRIATCNALLTDTNESLQRCLMDYNDALLTVEDLNSRLQAVRSELPKILNMIQEYETEIKQSMEWFRKNSDITTLSNPREVEDDLLRDCIRIYYDPDVGGDVCRINASCIWFVNTKYLGLQYKYDWESGYVDRLYGLQDFVNHGGGDCEDFSLFFKAEFDYLLSQCGDTPVRVVAWQDGIGKFFLDNARLWYLPDAEPVEWNGYVYPVVVCGDMYDPYLGEVNGHCVVAFSDIPIGDLSDLNHLIGAPMVEPQTGMYLGRINGDSGIFLVQSPNDLLRYRSRIWQVITDNDMLLYSFDYNQWLGYASFLRMLEEQRRVIENLPLPQ